ncbi:lim domain-containing serine threonine- kinase protein [Rutstroemia sp. NJR-2017a WRK4]|nr:lim domain-containing serine threonine- kinase protein [Rutstroemia sp. NJR-2017a WRK4]
MSNPTTILIEKLKLEPLLPVYYDMEGYIHIHFSLEVSIILAGNKQDIEMLLVVPPDVDFADVSKPYSISNIDDLSRRDASAIHDAKISDSLNVLYIQFDLSAKGFIVMKKKPTATIKPRNKTSTKLLCGLESLSNTTTFTVYIKPNDYALVGLEQLHNRIRNTPTDIRKTNMKEMYIEQVPELVEWNRFGPILLPPAYTQNPPQLFPEVQVPRSPSIIFEQETLSINTIEAAVAETPARIPTTPNSTSVHGIFSPISEELSESEEDWDDIEETSRNIEMNSDVDSDEERLANLNSRELSQQFNYDLEVSKILESKFTEWMQAAMQINSNVYEHKRLTTKLSILGNCVRTSNTGVFDATIPWCSTLLFYDPFDSDMTPGLWEERNSWLLSDMAKLIKWANEVHYGAETSPLLVNHFVKLGDTARTVALHHGYNDDSYKRQKCVCTTQVFIKFGKPVSSISGENSKPVSRKRLGTDSNTSKRVKI